MLVVAPAACSNCRDFVRRQSKMILGNCDDRSPRRRTGFGRWAVVALCMVSLLWSGPALSKDDDDEDAKADRFCRTSTST
jgi:hypothetical protein